MTADVRTSFTRRLKARARVGQRSALREWAAHSHRLRGDRGRQPCLVIGNCQAELIAKLLSESQEFCARYRVVPISAVHEIDGLEYRQLRRLLPGARLIVAHPVRDGYRGLQLGTKQIAEVAGDRCRVIRVPPLYYEGVFPFQVYVHAPGETVAVPAPLTTYHDLRVLHCASMGYTVRETLQWLHEFTPPQQVIRGVAHHSSSRLIERDGAVDVAAGESLLESLHHPGGLHTVNHPGISVLAVIANGVLDALDLAPLGRPTTPDLLGTIQTPRERNVLAALGLPASGSSGWVIQGRQVSWTEVVETQLPWYREHAELVRSAIVEHSERLEAFGFATSAG